MLALAAATHGCSPYTGLSQKTRPFIVKRDFAAALAQLEGVDGGKDRVLVLMERGLLHHYAGDFEQANAVFQEAEDLIDELYTKSLTTEAAALVTSDRIRPYDGAEFERVMIHVYRALSYVGLDQRDGALVEARKANANLALYTQDLEDPTYRDDPLVEYLTGLLYEWGGEWNDAWISYRKAMDAYDAVSARGGPPVPRSLRRAAFGAATRLGFREEAKQLADRFPDVRVPALAGGDGEVVVLVEAGFVPGLIEARVDVPILESDDVNGNNVVFVAGRAYHRIGHAAAPRVKLAYLLSIAYPVLDDSPPRVRSVEFRSAVSAVDLAAAGSGERLESRAEPQPRRLEHVADIAFSARENFADREPTILIRTIARALLKYIGKKQAEDAGGRAVGLAVDLLGSVIERADVRSWRSLPRDVFLLRAVLPEGVHDLTFETRGAGGHLLETVTLRDVRVVAGEMTWATYRVF